MSDEDLKRKFKKVVDEPAESLENGVKKGWASVKDFGKDVKDSVEKQIKKDKQK
jgi:hypothetical protein